MISDFIDQCSERSDAGCLINRTVSILSQGFMLSPPFESTTPVVFSWLLLPFAHGLTLELDAMSVVYEPVEDSISDSGVGYGLMPCCDRELAGDDGGA